MESYHHGKSFVNIVNTPRTAEKDDDVETYIAIAEYDSFAL